MKQPYYFLIVTLFMCCYAHAEDEDQPLEVERPRLDLFQNKLNTMMQDTASWLDDIDEHSDKKASSSGYLLLSWMPRTADLDDFDAKLKVAFDLPKINDKLSLIIDNDNEDELLLDYESDPFKDNQDNINLAFQYASDFSKSNNIKTRLGVSRSQLYVRSEAKLNWQLDNMGFELVPRIDYFYEDGWGPGLKGAMAYYLKKSAFSFSASWQKIEKESRSRRKVGIFHIFKVNKKQLLVSGIQYNKSNNKYDESNETYYLSMRYRHLAYKSWLYIEIEPFLDFNQVRDFRREFGIAISFISYYGT